MLALPLSIVSHRIESFLYDPLCMKLLIGRFGTGLWFLPVMLSARFPSLLSKSTLYRLWKIGSRTFSMDQYTTAVIIRALPMVQAIIVKLSTQ